MLKALHGDCLDLLSTVISLVYHLELRTLACHPLLEVSLFWRIFLYYYVYLSSHIWHVLVMCVIMCNFFKFFGASSVLNFLKTSIHRRISYMFLDSM
jgi:hypothetical protein